MASRRNLLISLATRVVVSVALLAVAAMIFMALFFTRELPGRIAHNDILPRIAVIEARPVPVARQWDGYGTAAARFSAAVPAQVRGLVVEVPPEIVAGVRVGQGQVLVRLDPADFEHEVEVAEQRIADIDSQIAQLDVERRRLLEQLELLQDEVTLARTDLDRLLAAREAIGATQREVDQARQALSAALRAEVAAREQVERLEPRQAQLRALRSQSESGLRVAQRNLERTTIRSPMEGYLQSVDVEQGETVGVDQRVARVVRLDRIEVPLRLPASARPDLAVGANVTLESTGVNDRQWDARIARIAPEDDERTRTVAVYVEVEQPDPRDTDGGNQSAAPLFPGQFVRGVAVAQQPRMRWIVPRRSIQGDRIRLVDGGVVDSRRIRVDFQIQQQFPEFGLPDAQWSVLVDPLPDGALVVVDGARTLAEGTRVEPAIANAEITENREELVDDGRSAAAGKGL